MVARSRLKALAVMGSCYLLPPMAWAQSSSAPNPLTLIDANGIRVTARIEAVAGGYAYSGTWFGLASLDPTVASKISSHGAKAGLNPGFDATIDVSPGIQIYGGVSLGFSQTFGTDFFDITDKGDASLENAFAGVRTINGQGQWNLISPRDNRTMASGPACSSGKGPAMVSSVEVLASCSGGMD